MAITGVPDPGRGGGGLPSFRSGERLYARDLQALSDQVAARDRRLPGFGRAMIASVLAGGRWAQEMLVPVRIAAVVTAEAVPAEVIALGGDGTHYPETLTYDVEPVWSGSAGRLSPSLTEAGGSLTGLGVRYGRAFVGREVRVWPARVGDLALLVRDRDAEGNPTFSRSGDPDEATGGVGGLWLCPAEERPWVAECV